MGRCPEFTMDDVKGLECKHIVYTEGQGNSHDDMLTVKEKVHFKDGRVVPNVRFVKNYKREFGITREGNRDHKEKKESEELSKLQILKCTQRGLEAAVSRALGRGQQSMRQLAMSPYLYGCDVTTPVLMKEYYMRSFPDCITDNTVAVLDIEADMISPTSEAAGRETDFQRPIMVSLTFRDKAIIAIKRSFVQGVMNVEEKIFEEFETYLGEYKRDRNINLEVVLVDRISEGIVKVINRAHEWMPDFITIWNINYDMPAMLAELQRDGYDPADVFSDPDLPMEFRYFRYKEGPAKKKTASGKEMTLAPAERWHVVECPASFYFIDAMCVYQKIRIAKGKENSYALDAVLTKLGLPRKLKFQVADKYHGLAWHMFMQRNYPVLYAIYNLFDCICVELLDEKTTDLSRTISLLCGFSEYARFTSQPRRTCDDLHFFFLENKRMAATTSREMVHEFDQYVIGLKDWIVTLPSHLVVDNGLKVIRECPDISTSLRAQVADLDVAGTYPTEEVILNISKETTRRELCAIKGISEQVRRIQGINLTGGHSNAVEICIEFFGAPTFKQMLEAFEAEKGLNAPQVELAEAGFDMAQHGVDLSLVLDPLIPQGEATRLGEMPVLHTGNSLDDVIEFAEVA